jgi:transposase-like protein
MFHEPETVSLVLLSLKDISEAKKLLIAAMIEMVISGVSTRKVTKTVELLTDGATVSKSFVSNLMKQLDPFVLSGETGA